MTMNDRFREMNKQRKPWHFQEDDEEEQGQDRQGGGGGRRRNRKNKGGARSREQTPSQQQQEEEEDEDDSQLMERVMHESMKQLEIDEENRSKKISQFLENNGMYSRISMFSTLVY